MNLCAVVVWFNSTSLDDGGDVVINENVSIPKVLN